MTVEYSERLRSAIPRRRWQRNPPPPTNLSPTPSPALQWWRTARLGVLFHISVTACRGADLGYGYSRPLPSEVQALIRPDGKPPERLSLHEYQSLYRKFNPHGFDAQAWVDTAAAAGVGYVVLTAKGHDGFCLWDTDQTDYKITSPDSPFGRDIVAEVADACHRSNMRLGLYYSQRDWHHPAFLRGDTGTYQGFMDAQIRELLTRYGRIDLLWADSYGLTPDFDDWLTSDNAGIVRDLQPEILINGPSTFHDSPNASPDGFRGDFDTHVQHIAPFPADRPWVSRIAMHGDYWGHRLGPFSYSHRECVHALVRCAAADGNLLLGVSSGADGLIPESQHKALTELGSWLSAHGETVMGTRRYPVPNAAWGGATQTSDAVFIHIIDPDAGPVRIPAFESWDSPAEVLTGGTVKIATEDGGHLTIEVQAGDQDPTDTIVKLAR